jgi:hypothetical protein
MLALHRQEMRHEPLLHGSGQHRHPILLSFATPDHDLVAIEVEVLDAEPDTLLKPEARAVQQRHDEPHHAVNMGDEPADFFSTEHDRQLVGHPCSRHMLDRPDIEAEHLTVQKHQRAQRLILRRRADSSVDGEP